MGRFAGRLPLATLLALALAGCAVPPSTAYVSGSRQGGPAVGLNLGQNASGEACTQQAHGEGAADVFCGTWQQPSAQVRSAGPAGPQALPQLATASAWRSELDGRFACEEPRPTTILGNAPALVMQCTRRLGGWPYVALVASIDNVGWYADGVLPSLPPMERALGVMSGRLKPEAATQAQDSAADALLADRLAARAFSSGDIGQYEALMAAGTRANQAENFASAEKAFRAALALQQKALGADAPGTATPLLLLALQLSNQGRSVEADALMARAARLVAGSDDPDLRARLADTQALNALNQGHAEQALTLLRVAEQSYAARLPPEVLHARPRPAHGLIVATSVAASTAGVADMLPNRDLLTDVSIRTALLGTVEARRYEAIVLRDLGRFGEADVMLTSASDLARGNGLRQPVLTARLARTEAENAAAQGHPADAAAGFERATRVFAGVLPGTRPVAETQLLAARQLARQGDEAGALQACEGAATMLRQLKIGVEAMLLQPCLDVFGAASEKAAPDRRQALLTQMFEVSQLAQGSVTSQQIAQATARLSANARDPKVAMAIRNAADSRTRLEELVRRRDEAAQTHAAGDQPGSGSAPPVDAVELDKQIAAARVAADDAEATLQAAAPNFGQLVQQVAPAADVLAALGPDEAFAGIDLAPDTGWVFLLRDGRISAARVPGGSNAMTKLVARVRASIEGDGPPRFDTEAAQALYSALFGKLGPQLAGMKSLVVAPSGPLLSLPFGVLLTGPADPDKLGAAPWLLRQATIAHVPAAANFVSLRKIAGGSRATKPWFGFGDFQPVTQAQAQRSFPGATCRESAQLFAGLPPLPFAQKELAAAQLVLGASASDELLGAAFTAPAVLGRHLKNYRILHFATHALLPTDLACQNEPAIVTSAPQGAADASGALLTASAVTDMDLDADAVILSACNSGGPSGGGAGQSLSGLARSFFYAGARSLVVTHWSVDDRTAAFLVAVMLQKLRAGHDGGMAGSLRAAQLELLDGAGKNFAAGVAHPFYWAPFALIGEGGGGRRAVANNTPPGSPAGL